MASPLLKHQINYLKASKAIAWTSVRLASHLFISAWRGKYLIRCLNEETQLFFSKKNACSTVMVTVVSREKSYRTKAIIYLFVVSEA